jgi:DNA-directed RNA polymerase III subunit RPC6
MASAASSSRSFQDIASELYGQCRHKFSPSHLFYQHDLLGLGVIPNNSVELLLQCTQSLVDRSLFRVHEDKDNRIAWKLISQEDAER